MDAIGTVKWFNDTKGFGFIQPEGGGADIFVHHSAIQMEGYRSLKQGARVAFELVNGPKGLNAQNIRSLDPPRQGKARSAEQAAEIAPDPVEPPPARTA